MAIPTDQVDYFNGFVDNIKIILDKHKEYLGVKSIFDTGATFIANFPAITIELDSYTEDRKEMPRKNTLIALYDITWYTQQFDEATLRREIRKGINDITTIFRENVNLNGFTARLGSTVASATPFILEDGENLVGGGVVTLECKKSIPFAVVPSPTP